MPPLPSPGAVLRVQFNTGVGGSIEAGSRFFLSYSGSAPSGGDLTSLADLVHTSWATHIAPVVYEAEALHGVIIEDLSSDTGATGEWTGTEVGTLTASEGLTATTCMVMNHQTGVRYRGGHPRTYLRCGAAGGTWLVSANEWEGSFITAVNGAWSSWIAEILAASGIGVTLTNIVNVSYYLGYNTSTPPWRGPGYKYPPKLRDTPRVEPITGTAGATKLGSQRRRLNI